MKKKLLFVIDSLHSGGAEKSLISLLNLLDYGRYDVDLLTFKSGGLYTPLVSKNVNRIKSPEIFNKMTLSLKELLFSGQIEHLLWRIKTSSLLRLNEKFSKINHGAQLMWPSLSKMINNIEEEYDVAIAYSQGTPTYFVAEKVKAMKKLCWINIDYKFAGYSKDFDSKYYDKFERIVAVSEVCKKVLLEVYPEYKDKVVTIYDIISEDLVNEMSEMKRNVYEQFHGFRILTVGRLVYQKGYEMAIDAAEILIKKGIKLKWYAIGEGSLKNKLQNLVNEKGLQDNFIFLGTYTNPYPFIKECDIYCQPSRFEGFGLAIAEARILNKPIVATNFEIVHDQIESMRNGIITEMNAKSISEGILKLIEDSGLRKRIIDNVSKESVGTEAEINKIYKLIDQ